MALLHEIWAPGSKSDRYNGNIFLERRQTRFFIFPDCSMYPPSLREDRKSKRFSNQKLLRSENGPLWWVWCDRPLRRHAMHRRRKNQTCRGKSGRLAPRTANMPPLQSRMTPKKGEESFNKGPCCAQNSEKCSPKGSALAPILSLLRGGPREFKSQVCTAQPTPAGCASGFLGPAPLKISTEAILSAHPSTGLDRPEYRAHLSPNHGL